MTLVRKMTLVRNQWILSFTSASIGYTHWNISSNI
nr:MAG TPA: hypothetical protein [Bacteriophage sp.]